MSKDLHHDSLWNPWHCKGTGYIMAKIVKFEVGEHEGFGQPANPHRHGIGAKSREDERLLVQRSRKILK